MIMHTLFKNYFGKGIEYCIVDCICWEYMHTQIQLFTFHNTFHIKSTTGPFISPTIPHGYTIDRRHPITMNSTLTPHCIRHHHTYLHFTIMRRAIPYRLPCMHIKCIAHATTDDHPPHNTNPADSIDGINPTAMESKLDSIPPEILKELRRKALAMKDVIKLGRRGVAPGLVSQIKNRWKTSEVPLYIMHYGSLDSSAQYL